MHHIEPVECVCGATLHIREYRLGLVRTPRKQHAPCPVCGRTVYETELDGFLLVEVITRRAPALPVAPAVQKRKSQRP
ncbi:hypothetical protein [Cupriavidus campinensis]